MSTLFSSQVLYNSFQKWWAICVLLPTSCDCPSLLHWQAPTVNTHSVDMTHQDMQNTGLYTLIYFPWSMWAVKCSLGCQINRWQEQGPSATTHHSDYQQLLELSTKKNWQHGPLHILLVLTDKLSKQFKNSRKDAFSPHFTFAYANTIKRHPHKLTCLLPEKGVKTNWTAERTQSQWQCWKEIIL